MKKELPIIAPEGYEIDKERMVFVQKEIELFPDEDNLKTVPLYFSGGIFNICFDNNEFLRDKILAFSQLIELRDEVNRRDGFVVDWKNSTQSKYCVEFSNTKQRFIINIHSLWQRPFAFRTKEIAQEFAEKYKELIDQCPDLI